ncbi:hypothetical protein CRG98_026298, partial [Punica granatum]
SQSVTHRHRFQQGTSHNKLTDAAASVIITSLKEFPGSLKLIYLSDARGGAGDEEDLAGYIFIEDGSENIERGSREEKRSEMAESGRVGWHLCMEFDETRMVGQYSCHAAKASSSRRERYISASFIDHLSGTICCWYSFDYNGYPHRLKWTGLQGSLFQLFIPPTIPYHIMVTL